MCESSRNAFTCGRLDRLSNHRHEPSFVAEALQSPSAKFLAFHGLRPLLVAAGVSSPMLQPHWLALEELQRAVLHRDATRKFDLAPESHYVPSSGRHQVPGSSEHVAAALRPDYDAALHVDWTLLGSRAPGTDAREREFLFAVNVTKTCTDASEIESHVGGEPRARFADLRGAVVSLSREDASIIGQGRGLLAWHEKETFCSSCRSPLMQANGGTKRVCQGSASAATACSFTEHFPRTQDPVVIALIQDKSGQRCLLGRNKNFPTGMYSCLAGFVEAAESLEEAVLREVAEESGVVVDIDSLQYHSSQPWPFPASFMCGFVGTASDETIVVDPNELEDARWFHWEQVKQGVANAFLPRTSTEFRVPPGRVAIAGRLIEHWLEQHEHDEVK